MTIVFLGVGIVILGFVFIALSNRSKLNSLLESENQAMKNIDPKEAYTLIQKRGDDPNFVILDVRTPGEFSQGHIEKAVNIDYYSKDFRAELTELDRQKTYFIYCRSGNRSGKTLRMMKGLNFSNAYNMTGGISSWNAQKLPIVK